MSRHAKIGLQMLMDRRTREESTKFYRDAEQADNLIKERADFETRTRNRFQQGEITRRARQRASDSEARLDARRAKLSQLLLGDENQFSQEIVAHVETPANRRLRLMDSLKDLQNRRQQEHDEYVRVKNDQGWRDSCDPLRHQISEALERQVIAERDQQVIARDIARMSDDADEAKYAQQVRQNLKEFREEQQQQLEERQLKIRRNRETWLGAMAFHQRRDAQEKQADWEEGQKYQKSAQARIQEAKEAAEAKASVQAARRRELDTLNASQLGYQRAAREADRELDRQDAAAAAEALRKEQEDRLVARLVKIRKVGPTQSLFLAQHGRTVQAEADAEWYIQQAQDEANRKEDEWRAADAAKRRSLMLDAVSHRVQTMKLHDEQREHKKVEKEEERQELEAELALKRQLDQEELETRRRAVTNQYNMLASQCALKHELDTKARQEEKDSVTALIQSWKDEETRIQEELAHPHALVGGRFRGHR
jgi:hypothetical protein